MTGSHSIRESLRPPDTGQMQNNDDEIEIEKAISWRLAVHPQLIPGIPVRTVLPHDREGAIGTKQQTSVHYSAIIPLSQSYTTSLRGGDFGRWVGRRAEEIPSFPLQQNAGHGHQ